MLEQAKQVKFLEAEVMRGPGKARKNEPDDSEPPILCRLLFIEKSILTQALRKIIFILFVEKQFIKVICQKQSKQTVEEQYFTWCS